MTKDVQKPWGKSQSVPQSWKTDHKVVSGSQGQRMPQNEISKCTRQRCIYSIACALKEAGEKASSCVSDPVKYQQVSQQEEGLLRLLRGKRPGGLGIRPFKYWKMIVNPHYYTQQRYYHKTERKLPTIGWREKGLHPWGYRKGQSVLE